MRDSTGAVVPGATVTLKNVGTGIVATTTSGEQGTTGSRTCASAATPCAPSCRASVAEAEDVQVTVNARLRVDLALKVGNVGETVVVTGAATLLESESSDRGQVIGKEQIVNLPLNGRAYADLALLSPGVRKSAISDSRDASFNVHGLRSAVNSFMLDGVDNNSYGTSNQGFSNQVVQLSPDAVEEFKVQTNNFSAEFGRTGGAVVNASMRSGTNQFRGSVGVQPERRPQRDRLLQALQRREAQAESQPAGRLRRTPRPEPHLLLRRLRGLPPGFQGDDIRDDPDDGAAAGHSGQANHESADWRVFADGVIPSSAITPFAKEVLAGLPEPTLPGISNNFDSLPRREDFNDSTTSRWITSSVRG